MVIFGIDHLPGTDCETELFDAVFDHLFGTAHVVKHDGWMGYERILYGGGMRDKMDLELFGY